MTVSILVFMSDNRKLEANFDDANYHTLCSVINYHYCKKHGYDFKYYRPYKGDKWDIQINNCTDPNSGEPRHAAWSKLLSTQIALDQHYDFIVYIDSDCIFKDLERRIEDIIQMFSHNDIIFLNDKPDFPEKPNTGFFICKNNANTKKLIKNWYNLSISKKNTGFAWEQSAFWEIYKSYNVGIYDSMFLEEEVGQYLRHIHHGFNEMRLPYFKKFIKTNNINFENVSLIDCNIYDTNSITERLYGVKISVHKNKEYSWGSGNIIFLEGGKMNAFGKGTYIQKSLYNVDAYFGGHNHSLLFNKDYTEFTSVRKHDNEIVKGRLLSFE